MFAKKNVRFCLMFACIDRRAGLEELLVKRPEFQLQVLSIRKCEERTQIGLSRKLRAELKRAELKKLSPENVVEVNNLKDGSSDGPNHGIWLTLPSQIHTCLHTCILTYINTYIYSYIHTYIHICIHTYIHTYMHTYLHTYMPTYMHTFIHAYIHAYLHT